MGLIRIYYRFNFIYIIININITKLTIVYLTIIMLNLINHFCLLLFNFSFILLSLKLIPLFKKFAMLITFFIFEV